MQPTQTEIDNWWNWDAPSRLRQLAWQLTDYNNIRTPAFLQDISENGYTPNNTMITSTSPCNVMDVLG